LTPGMYLYLSIILNLSPSILSDKTDER
jgi:hypothetical protein